MWLVLGGALFSSLVKDPLGSMQRNTLGRLKSSGNTLTKGQHVPAWRMQSSKLNSSPSSSELKMPVFYFHAAKDPLLLSDVPLLHLLHLLPLRPLHWLL